MNFSVLYQDKDIAVCIKPTGMLSQSDEKGESGLKELLEEHLGKTVHLIHRLDRPVSGIMVFALNPKAASRLSADIADHSRFIKEYMVCVSGKPELDTAILKDMLFRDRFNGKTFVVDTKRKGAKDASLEYTRLDTVNHEDFGELSLIKIRLHTGRTHQIRVQFASRGYPVAGDGKYGSRIKAEGIALHSYKLSFPHPYTGKTVEFTAPMPTTPVFSIFQNQIENDSKNRKENKK